MKLLIKALTQHLKEFQEKNIKLIVSGRVDDFSHEVKTAIKKAVRLTKNNTKAVVNLALNYGGRTELLDAVKQLLADNIPPDKIDEQVLASHLYSNGQLPDPDLIIRTGGEKRLSNFLPWQSVYSELYFTDTLWPDFSQKDLQAALREFASRERRFGK
jgi:undecaprenyl diphosphate synthase